ncbi:hypothetical protein CRYUN_Cryun06bG0067100 [Craigia yunnanensis]
MVCRDSTGMVWFSAIAKRRDVYSPLQAELLAILFGLEKATENGYKNVQVESDSLLVVKEIEKGSNSSCEWGCIVNDICNYVGLCDLGYVCFVRREANFFAHNLAKQFIDAADDVLWWWETPSNICNPDLIVN